MIPIYSNSTWFHFPISSMGDGVVSTQSVSPISIIKWQNSLGSAAGGIGPVKTYNGSEYIYQYPRSGNANQASSNSFPSNPAYFYVCRDLINLYTPKANYLTELKNFNSNYRGLSADVAIVFGIYNTVSNPDARLRTVSIDDLIKNTLTTPILHLIPEIGQHDHGLLRSNVLSSETGIIAYTTKLKTLSSRLTTAISAKKASIQAVQQTLVQKKLDYQNKLNSLEEERKRMTDIMNYLKSKQTALQTQGVKLDAEIADAQSQKAMFADWQKGLSNG